VQYAYSVLSNAKMKGIYDSYGEQGLKMYESYMNFAEGSSGGGPTMVPLAPAQLASVVCGALGLLVVLLTALFILLYMKLNGASDAPLSLLLIPLWILDSVALIVVYVFVSGSARKGQATFATMQPLVTLLLYVAFQILLVIRVDGGASILPWAAVFAPLYTTELIDAVTAAARCRPSAHEAEKAAGKAHPVFAWHVLLTLGWSVARIGSLVMTVFNLDAVAHLNWALVFLPIFAYVALYVCFGCQQLQAPVTNEREQMLQMGHRISLLVSIILTVVLVLATLILNGVINTWLPVFILPFVFSGCFYCCCCCVLCCLRMAPRSGPVDVPPGDGMGETPASTARSYGEAPSPPTPTEDAPLLPGNGKVRGVYSSGADNV